MPLAGARSGVPVTEQQLVCVSRGLHHRLVWSSVLAIAVGTAGARLQADQDISQGQMGSSHCPHLEALP